ncbi:MAG: hypothetical protein AB7T49_17060 [Oligoflexales bacterium]
MKKFLFVLALSSTMANAGGISEGRVMTLDTWGGQAKGVVLYDEAAQSVFEFIKGLRDTAATREGIVEVVAAKNIKCSFNPEREKKYQCVFSIGNDGVSYPST